MNPSNLLRGNRVRLTALTADDLPVLTRWYEDAEFLRFFDSRPAFPKAQPELARWLEELQKAKNTFTFGIRSLDGDELFGYLELDEVDWQHSVCGLGIGIGERVLWGQGYGFEASQLALEFAFHELNLHRVQVTVFSYNRRSQALFEKLGFQREGVFREFLERDGQRHDMILYGLLRQEWQAQRAMHRGNLP